MSASDLPELGHHDDRCAINLGLLGASCNCGWTSRFIALAEADSQRFRPEAKSACPPDSDENRTPPAG